MTKIAIIGAGIAGLTLATRLQGPAEVVVFEKSRGVGGRMASRRVDSFGFDHGAQFFTARSEAFREFLKPYQARGLVQQWQPRLLSLAPDEQPRESAWSEQHHVAVPGMTALCKAMASGLDLRFETRVEALHRQPDGRWRLAIGADRSTAFDWVICTAPAPQTHVLLPPEFAQQYALPDDTTMVPCIALLLGLESAPGWNFDAARIQHDVLAWLSCEASRPGRAARQAVTLHSTATWAAAHLDDPDDVIAASMLAALNDMTGQSLPPIAVQQVKRWRYAKADALESPRLLLDPDLQLAAGGDWAHNGRVEGAFLSGHSLADAMMAHIQKTA